MAEKENIKVFEMKRKPLKWKFIIPVFIILAAISVASIKFILPTLPSFKYHKAMELYENGRYEESIDIFTTLGNYRDSEQLILSSKYNIAKSYFSRADYDKAINEFKELGPFKDSVDMVKSCLYFKAMGYASNKEWDAAIETITPIIGYSDSEEQIKVFTYNKALESANNKDLKSAIKILTSLGNYRNSEDLVSKYTYDLSFDLLIEKVENRDWNSAIEILYTMPDVPNKEELIRQYKINELLKINPILPEVYYLPKDPSLLADYKNILIYMVSNNNISQEIKFSNNSNKHSIESMYNKAFLAFEQLYSNYPEIACNFDDISIDTNTESLVKIRLINYRYDDKMTSKINKEFRNESYNIIEKLIEEGKLKSSMSEREKALILYKWIADNLEYDYSFSADSYTGYGAAINRKAVCQGYTSLYNMLCKIVGIDVIGVPGKSAEDGVGHLWTLANLDGEKFFIDSTWGDGVYYYDLDYFAVKEDFLSKTHVWNIEKYNCKLNP